MPGYVIGFTSVAAAPGAPYFTFHTTTRQGYIWSVSYFLLDAASTAIAIVYPSNSPVASSSINPAKLNQDDAAPTCAADVAWTTTPTIPAPPVESFGDYNFGPAVGAGAIDPVPQIRSIQVPKSSYLVWYNKGIVAGSRLAVTIRYEE